jgi:methionine synthase II (cobalamin-independent)
MLVENIEEGVENKFIYNNDFYRYYDQELLDDINKIFSDDFDTFNFEKITNIDEFMQKYKNNIAKQENILPKIIFEANMNNILDFEQTTLIHTLKDAVVTFIENNEKIFQISEDNIFNNQYKVLFRKIFKAIGDKIEEKKKLDLCGDINDYASKNNSTDIQNHMVICNQCNNFKSFNHISMMVHQKYCSGQETCDKNDEETVAEVTE